MDKFTSERYRLSKDELVEMLKERLNLEDNGGIWGYGMYLDGDVFVLERVNDERFDELEGRRKL